MLDKQQSKAAKLSKAILPPYCRALEMETMRCWLAKLSDEPCAGRLQKAHLISKQVLKNEVLGRRPRPAGMRRPAGKGTIDLYDPRLWVPACERHHQRLDGARSLRIPRERLPAELELFADAHGLSWFLDREYGPSQRLVESVRTSS